MPHTPTVGILQIYSLSEIGGPLYYFTKSTSKHKWNNNNCWNSMKQVVPPPRNDNILMMSLSQPHNNKCTLCLIHVFSWHRVKQKYIGLRSIFHIASVLSTPTVVCLWVSFLQFKRQHKLLPLSPLLYDWNLTGESFMEPIIALAVTFLTATSTHTRPCVYL